MTQATVTVVKVGGSLFGMPQLPDRLTKWLQEQPPGRHILLAGGGDLAEAIRRADEIHDLGEEPSHWLCVDVLHITARLLATLLGDIPLVESFEELQQLLHSDEPPGALIFNPHEFLHQHEPGLPGDALPRDWSATSDSIAARLAGCLAADELVLFKAVDPPEFQSLADLAARGYLDRYFPLAARGLKDIRFVSPR